MTGRRRRSGRRLRRRLLLLAGAAALAGGMATAVARGSAVRSLEEEIARLEEEISEARMRLLGAMRTVDSLTSRERILRAADPLGLRPADDDEITFLREPGGSGGDPGEER